MTCVVRLTVIASTACLLAARPAGTQQVMCNDIALLPNPIVVAGSNTFEQVIGQLAVKLSAEPVPRSIVFATGDPTSCSGIASVANGFDLGGGPGRYFTLSGSSVTNNDCTFAAGQKADVAVSDVFYESCANLPQPKPAEITDVTGPVQATVFIVPRGDITGYLSYQEAQAIFGCGVSSTKPIAGFNDPTHVFCRNPSAGPQIVLAKSLGLSPTTLTSPRCENGGSSTGAIAGNVSTTPRSVSFITADGLEVVRKSEVTPASQLAFQGLGQTQAYYVDARTDFTDRQNVRDGHYTLWGYQHLIAKNTDGSPSRQAADFISLITGAKNSPNIDHVVLEARAGLIPQCAMRVKRTSDGGLLSPYTPPQPCACAFMATISKTIPPGCVFCADDSACAGGSACRRNFCE